MYRITIKKEKEYLNKLNHLKIMNMIEEDDTITFSTDKKGMLVIRDSFSDVLIVNENLKVYRWIKKNIIGIISIMILILLLINQGFIISEVNFTNYNTENEEVLEFVKSRLKKVGPFYYLNDSINNINSDLRKNFYKYEWISVYKKGASLNIEISLEKETDEKEDNLPPGSLYANYDSYIKMYHLEKGIVKIQEGQSVKKGDLLISGEILNYNSDSELVYPKGFVIGEVLEYKEVVIDKEETFLKPTGKIEKIEKYIYFNKDVQNNSKFENYKTVIKENFHIGNFLKKITIYNYEMIEVTNSYTKEEAIMYGETIVRNEFLKNKTNKYEKIIYINLVDISEDEDSYYIRYIMKSDKNIAIFKPF